MKKIPNIALIGRTRSGKDSVAEILTEWGFPVKRIAFGDSMKEMFHLENPDVQKFPKRIDLYQKYGQSMRKIDPDIFVRPTMSKLWFEQELDKSHERDTSYIVTDVRQPNEFKAVKDAGFVIVKVHASEEVRVARMKANGETVSQEILNAETESYIDTYEYDHLLVNNWTRDELKRQMVQLIKKLTLKEEN
ncbi:hypothetical protein [Bacillus paranthracis]|uniref:hypothetical protein n=1 Tax=Bacillus paranthracis TaxID=2026186 RepID=UPI001F09386C|nr:hypothetical protein [Bacillus paranthracis]